MLSYVTIFEETSLFTYTVKYRINFKIALLVFKCLKHCAPGYLQELIVLHKPSAAYDFRRNCNLLLLEKTSQLKTTTNLNQFSHMLQLLFGMICLLIFGKVAAFHRSKLN